MIPPHIANFIIATDNKHHSGKLTYCESKLHMLVLETILLSAMNSNISFLHAHFS